MKGHLILQERTMAAIGADTRLPPPLRRQHFCRADTVGIK